MDNKALAKGLAKFSLIVFILSLVGVFVFNYSMPVYATHTSDATIDPGWVKCGTYDTFTVTVAHTGDPADDPIYNVKIYNDTNNAHTDFTCGPTPTGWFFKGYNIINQYCEYETSKDPTNTYLINPGEHLNFTFSANITDECSHQWQTATTDIKEPVGDVVYRYPTITADCAPPETTKTYGDPKKPGYFDYKKTTWITSSTPIYLEATDDLGPHDSHINETWYRIFWYNPELCIENPDCEYQWYGYDTEKWYQTEVECYEDGNVVCDTVLWYPKTDWILYYSQHEPEEGTGPFNIPQESIHKICYYSIDKVGNREEKECQMVIVDNTPPDVTKEVGDPKAGVEFKSLGDGEAEWTTDQSHTGDYSVRLTSPTGPSDVALARITRDFGNFGDITELSYWTYLESGELGYHPYIQVWIDIDDDGDIYDFGDGGANLFQAEPYYAWQYYGYPAPSPGWNEWRSFGDPSLVWSDINWDENVASLQPLSYWQSIYGSYPVKRIVIQVGYGTGWDNTIAYADDLVINGNTILSEPFITPTWVTQNTPITLDCVDQGDHPVNQETVWWRFSTWTDPDGEPTYSEWYSSNELPLEIYFPEDSWHDLEYYCVDHLGNEGEHHIQYYTVDTQRPIINKTIVGPQVGTCPPESPGDECYIQDGVTEIQINVYDPEPHPVNDVWCQWGYYYTPDDGDPVWYGWYPEGTSWTIIFEEDSTHELWIWCWDALENKATDDETFLVDSTPPNTTKTFGEPNHPGRECNRWPHWCLYPTTYINSSTPIYLNAEDEKVGVHETWYKVYWYNWTLCVDNPDCITEWYGQYTQKWYEDYEECYTDYPNVPGSCYEWSDWYPKHCEEFTDDPANCREDGWILYWSQDNGGTGEFVIPQESWHKICHYSIDKLGNEEEKECQLVTVDNTPPEVYKEVGYPQVECQEGEDCDYWVTQDTPIYLYCEDPYPHPVNYETIWYRYYFCDEEPPEEWTEYPIDTIYFPEDSCHILEYYCVDALGNAGPIQTEIDIVDTQPPTIYKTVGEPKHFDGEYWYISNETEISLEAIDEGVHAIDDVTCYYGYKVDPYFPEDFETGAIGWTHSNFTEDGEDNWALRTESIGGTEFPSTVYGTIGNGIDEILEQSYLESPWIDLSDASQAYLSFNSWTYDEGDCPDYDAEYIEISTDGTSWDIITDCPEYPLHNKDDRTWRIFVYDISSYAGETIKIRFRYDTVDSCCSYEEGWYIDNVQISEFAYTDEYIEPITFPEESLHELEIKCYDALGNTEVDIQQYKVDLTPPITWKEYDEPYYTDGNSEWISSETPIYLYFEDSEGLHHAGVNETWYKDVIVPDEYCEDPELYCQPVENGNWNLYWKQGDPEPMPIFKQEESCHIIEYYSIDKVGNKEPINWQCVFVDNSAPEPNKTLGDPKTEWRPTTDLTDPDRTDFYPEIVDKCWNESSEEYIECWKVTMLTPIKLDCDDSWDGEAPHPVDQEILCYRVELDGEDATDEYCEPNEDGWCCGGEAPYTFYFDEETEHELEYYCIDALENEGSVDIEKFKVEGTAFELNLYKKWNLISVPFVLLNNDINEVFEGIEEYVNSVWRYNGETWYVWTPGGAPDSFNTIDPGWGYWVLANNDTTLKIGGSLFSPATIPPSRDLVAGWNLIGYYGTDWQEYENDPYGDYQICEGDPEFWRYSYCSLSSLIDTQQGYPRWSSLWTYRNCGGHDTEWIGINVCPYDGYNTMYAGKGYWIEMDVGDTYIPATTCMWNWLNYCPEEDYWDWD